jgi:hypothetical protein
MSLLIRRIQDQSHGPGKRLPFGLFGGKMLFALCGKPIVSRPLALIGQFPGCGNQALRLEPMKRRIKRSGFHLKQFFGCPLDVFGDRGVWPSSWTNRREFDKTSCGNVA